MMRRRLIQGLLLSTMLLAAACTPATGPAPGFSLPSIAPTGGGASTTEGSSQPGGTPGQSDPTTGSTAPQYISAVDRAREAARDAVGGQYGTEEFGLTMQQLTAKAEEVESLIGTCMAAAGFEYIPVDFSTIRKAMISDKSAPGLSGSAYLAQYGHGITTQPDKPIVRIGLGELNLRIVDGLSEADQVAYMRTLFGDDRNATFAFGLESEDFSRTGGCTRTAIEQVFTAKEMQATYFNPADALVEQDPRAQAALAEWSACMAETGFSYRHPDDVDSDLQVRFDSITQGQDPEELTGPALEALMDLQDEERAAAVASDSCERRYLEPVLDSIEAEFFGRN